MIVCRVCGAELELGALPVDVYPCPYFGKNPSDPIWVEPDGEGFWLSCDRMGKRLHEPRVVGAGDLLDLISLERELR